MTDTYRIPRHLQILVEEWTAFAQSLEAKIVPRRRVQTDELPRSEFDRFRAITQRELAWLSDWSVQVMAWVEGPLAAALCDPGIESVFMRRLAQRLAHYADGLVERRHQLALLAGDPALRAAGPRLDAMHEALLQQMLRFVHAVLNSLDPANLPMAQGKRDGDSLEIHLFFSVRIDAETKEYNAWLERVRAGWRAEIARDEGQRPRTQWARTSLPPAALPTLPPTPPRKAPNPWPWVVLQWLLGAALIATIFTWGWQAVVVLLFAFGMAWCIRHPVLALMALLFLFGFGSS